MEMGDEGQTYEAPGNLYWSRLLKIDFEFR